MLVRSERPDPCLLAVSFDAGFVHIDDIGVLNLAANLFVLTATGARSALGRVPRGRGREFQSVELLEAIGDLPIGKTVFVPRESRLRDDVHPELPLIGAVGVGSNDVLFTGVALVAVAVVLSSFGWLRIRDLFDESEGVSP
jgi:hypothetical protein